MVVPAGDHEIKFIFKPASYYFGNKVSLASSVFADSALRRLFLQRIYPEVKV